MTDVFVSYSRRDSEIVSRVCDALRNRGKVVFIDVGEQLDRHGPERAGAAAVAFPTQGGGSAQDGAPPPGRAAAGERAPAGINGIPPAAPWLEEIRSAIAAADTVLMMVSPDSCTSPVCQTELDCAVGLNKRLIPVLVCDTPARDLPGAIAVLNLFVLGSAQEFDVAIDRLIDVLDTDIEGLRLHTRLTLRALEWDSALRDRSRLLRGQDLVAAERWLTVQSGRKPRPTSAQTAYILTSRATAARRQRVFMITAAVLILVMAALTSAAGIEWHSAVIQRQTAIRNENLALFNLVTAEANEFQGTDATLAAQLNLIAYRLSPAPDIYTDLINTESVALSAPLADHSGTIGAASVAFSPDGRALAVIGDDQTVRLWNLTLPGSPGLMHLSLTGASKTVEVAFGPHGHMVAAFGKDGTFWLWNLANLGHPVPLAQRIPSATAGTSFSAMFSPDGQQLLITAGDPLMGSASVHLWDIANPDRPALVSQSLTGNSSTATVAFSPDGRLLAAFGMDGRLWLWNLANPDRLLPEGRPVTTGDMPDPGFSAEFSSAGRTLAILSDDGISLWNIANPDHPTHVARPLTGTSNAAAMAFSPDGRVFATEDTGGTFQIWDLANPSRPAPLGQPIAVDTSAGIGYSVGGSVAFGPGGRILATTSPDHTIRLWNLSDPAHPIPLGQPLTGSAAPVTSIAFSPGGQMLISASFDGAVRLWDIPQMMLVGATSPVSSVAFSPDGRTLATVSGDAARLWDLTGQDRAALAGQPVVGAAGSSVAFSEGGRMLAIVRQDGAVGLWSLADQRHPALLGQIPADGNDPLVAASFSPTGPILATASQFGAIRLWNLGDPRHPAPFGQLTANFGASSLAFSPDGRTLATGGPTLWNVAGPGHPTLIGKPTAPSNDASLAFSPDGRTLAITSGDTVQLWNVTDPRHPTLIGQPLSGHTDTVTSAAFSADGRTLATASQDGTIRLWDLSNLSHLAPIGQPLTDGIVGTVDSIAFSPDGAILAAGSDDQIVRLWDLDVSQAIERICATITNISYQQWHEYIPQIQLTSPCT